MGTKSAGTEIGNEVDVATGLIESPQAAVVTTPVVSAPTESITVTEVVVDEVAAEAPAVLAVEETKTTDSIKNLVSEKVQMMREAEALRAEKLFLENEKLKAALSKMEK